MPAELVDAFFSITDSGTKVGFVVQGAKAARFGWAEDRMLDRYAPLLGKRWPQLPAAFTAGFDAALAMPGDDPWTVVFRGGQCLRLHPLDGSVGQVSTVNGQYPGLPAAFGSGIDAALPSATSGEAYFFKGGQCVRYDLRSAAPVETKSLAETWLGLSGKAPAFVNGISAAAVNPATGKAYLFKGSQYVRVILSTCTVETNAATVDDGSWPGLLRAFNPGRVYVARRPNSAPGYRSVDVVDLASRTVTGTLDLPINDDAWRSIGATPDGRFLYVAGDPAGICVDTANHQVVATFRSRATEPEPGYAYGPDEAHCHLVSTDNGPYLETVRTGTFSEVRRIPLSGGNFATGAVTAETSALGQVSLYGPYRIAPKQDGRLVYVSGRLSDYSTAVAEVDLEQKLVRQFFLPGGSGASDLALSPDGSVAHVASYERTLAFSTRNGEILHQNVLPPCEALALTPDGSALFCLPAAEGEGVLIADPATHQVLQRIPIEMAGGRGTGRGLAFSHGGAFAYVAEASEEGGFSLAVIDVEAREKTASIPLAEGSRLHWVAFAPS